MECTCENSKSFLCNECCKWRGNVPEDEIILAVQIVKDTLIDRGMSIEKLMTHLNGWVDDCSDLEIAFTLLASACRITKERYHQK